MNILFICNEYPPGKSGGIGSVTRTLSRQLVKMGHNIFVAGLYTPGYGGADHEVDMGVQVWRRRFTLDIGVIKNNYSKLDSVVIRSLKLMKVYQYDVHKSFNNFHKFTEELIVKNNIEIVEWPDFNQYFPDLPAKFTFPTLSVPLVVKYHGTASYISKQLNEKIDSKLYQIEKRHLQRASALVSVSQNTADNYQEFYHLNRTVKILYNSIDLPKLLYRDPSEPDTIIYTGTLTKLKGIESLMKAWNIVAKSDRKFRLKIFGKGKTDNLIPLLNKEALDSVEFKGFVTRDVFYQDMATAAAAVFPSYTECFAIAPLEAMAVGCPVIFTKRVSGPELITPMENGILIEPDNIEEIAEAILLLLNSPSKRSQFSVEGRKTIEHRFDIAKSATDHIAFYKNLLIARHD